MSEVRAVTIEIPEQLAQEAEALGLNVLMACRTGFAETMYRTRRALEWQEQNQEAIAAYNRWIEQHGFRWSAIVSFRRPSKSHDPEA